jgi:hypothetical protein
MPRVWTKAREEERLLFAKIGADPADAHSIARSIYRLSSTTMRAIKKYMLANSDSNDSAAGCALLKLKLEQVAGSSAVGLVPAGCAVGESDDIGGFQVASSATAGADTCACDTSSCLRWWHQKGSRDRPSAADHAALFDKLVAPQVKFGPCYFAVPAPHARINHPSPPEQ